MPRYTPPVEPTVTKAQLNKKVVEKNKQLQENNSNLAKSAKDLEVKSKELQMQVDSVKKDLTSEKQKKAKLEKSVKALDENLKEVSSEVASKSSELAQISDKATSLDKYIGQKETALKRIETNIAESKELKEDIAPLKKEKEKLESDISLQKVGLNDLASQEDIIKKRLSKVESDYEKARIPYDKELKAIKDTIKETIGSEQGEVNKLKEQAAKETKGINSVRSKCQVADKKIVQLNGVIEDKITELEDLQGSVDVLKRDKAILKRNMDESKERYSGWRTKALEDVAKLKLKGKLENIDKAGLREILDSAL
jgi:chromosome segregation protein